MPERAAIIDWNVREAGFACRVDGVEADIDGVREAGIQGAALHGVGQHRVAL